MQASSLLAQTPKPSDRGIDDAMSGDLTRAPASASL